MGGGIWSNGSLTLENGTLLKSNSRSRQRGRSGSYHAFGGAVYIAGGSANISNTIFTGNFAGGAVSDASAFGGALYVAAGQVVLTTSTVNNNYAQPGVMRTRNLRAAACTLPAAPSPLPTTPCNPILATFSAAAYTSPAAR